LKPSEVSLKHHEATSTSLPRPFERLKGLPLNIKLVEVYKEAWQNRNMAGKRKRQDTTEVVDGNEVNGDGAAKQREKFQEWLVDVLDILRE